MIQRERERERSGARKSKALRVESAVVNPNCGPDYSVFTTRDVHLKTLL
jgi:hypothetical protein